VSAVDTLRENAYNGYACAFLYHLYLGDGRRVSMIIRTSVRVFTKDQFQFFSMLQDVDNTSNNLLILEDYFRFFWARVYFKSGFVLLK